MENWMKSRKWAALPLAAWILMISLLAGCASNQQARKNDGSLQLSSEVSRIFQTYQVLPEYRYYYTGSDTKPIAIIGIDKNYTLDAPLWVEAADLTAEQLKEWVGQMLNFDPPVRTFGSYILNGKGEPVGIWYSPEDETPVAVHADNRVEIVAPTETREFGAPGGEGGDRD